MGGDHSGRGPQWEGTTVGGDHSGQGHVVGSKGKSGPKWHCVDGIYIYIHSRKSGTSSYVQQHNTVNTVYCTCTVSY